MKLLLLRPDSGMYTVLPPLGLMALAAYFRKHSNHEIRLFDGRERSASDEEILNEIRIFQPDAVGISILTMERTEGHHAAKAIKGKFPDLPVIIGGPYATSETSEVFENEAIDFAVVGEGEIPGLNLLNALQDGGDFSEIKGLAFRRNGEMVLSGTDNPIEDLNTLPQLAWDLIDLERYFHNPKRPMPMNLHVKSERTAPILTTRGCPYRCTYCHNLFGKKLRQRSVEHVMKEIRYLKNEKGVEEIEVIDDVFNLDTERAKSLALTIIAERLNLHFSFPNGLRADRMPEELIDLLVEMGTYRMVFAIESGSPELQKMIKKNLDLTKAKRAIEYAAGKKISIGAFFILGFLGETEEQMRMTIDFACRSRLSTASFFILTPFPNTEIYNQALEAGYPLDDYALTHYYALGVNISQVSDKKLSKLYNSAYRRFYLHPARIVRFFRTTPWRRFFFQKVWIALLFFFHHFRAEKRGDLEHSSSGNWKRKRYS